MDGVEDRLDLRKRCTQFALRVIRLAEVLPKKRAAWIISDQVLRSSMSIGANLSEAKGSGTRLEFKRFNEIALKSAQETRYWLELIQAAKMIPSEELEMLQDEVNQIIRMLAAGILRLKDTK